MLKSAILPLSFLLSLSFYGHAQSIDTLIDVGTHSLHFKIVPGKGTPILFESGNGDDGKVWEDLLPPIFDSTGAPLITYDRAGLGQSGIDTLNINFEKEIKDLESALKQLGFSKDLFIVSHSFGGFYSTLYSNRNKKKVKGAVYVDVALPCFFTKAWSETFTNAISTKDWEMIRQYKTGLYFVLQKLGEISAYMADKDMPKGIPVTLIAAEKLLPMVKENEVEQWENCLKSFGNLPNHKYVLAKDAGHKVWEDNQQIVIDEIVELYQKANQGANKKPNR